MERATKKVVWVGGDRDGEVMQLDARAASMVVPGARIPASLVKAGSNMAQTALTYWRVPVVWTPLGWRAMWNDRVEVEPKWRG